MASEEMSMSALRLCLLGTGKINCKHLKIVRKLRSDAEITVASRDRARAEAFHRQHGLAGAFASYDEALRSPEVDVVLIGTPPSNHRELVEACLDGGKSALIEKPVFQSYADLAALYPRMRDAAGLYMVAENLHYAPFHRRLKALCDPERLGQPLFLDLVKLGRSKPAGWRADAAEMPLGALHEGGVHWIRRLLDLALCFDGDGVDAMSESIVDVSCYGPERPLTAAPHEDTSMVVARHGSGLTSRLLHSWALPWRFIVADASKLVCERGAIYFDARGLWGRYYDEGGQRVLLPNLADAGGYTAMWRDFIECWESGRRPELDLAHIVFDFAYMDAAYRSRASMRPERLDLSPLHAAS
jgi:predicted dehydrogenase